ncbi:MAG: hypothetical protein K8R75_02575 [Deltaproteobacteria bacterium]|nr:hypothetical protein [Deltaproteobacteria bacterium]
MGKYNANNFQEFLDKLESEGKEDRQICSRSFRSVKIHVLGKPTDICCKTHEALKRALHLIVGCVDVVDVCQYPDSPRILIIVSEAEGPFTRIFSRKAFMLGNCAVCSTAFSMATGLPLRTIITS